MSPGGIRARSGLLAIAESFEREVGPEAGDLVRSLAKEVA